MGPYEAKKIGNRKVVSYVGNKIFPKIDDVTLKEFNQQTVEAHFYELGKSDYFYHLHKIDSGIFLACVEYFKRIGAEWCNLPLTTLMISSPGEVYAGKNLDYTTDALPVKLKWFDNQREIFLSESSQFYLELQLVVEKIDRVFSIYNSFRKEKTDYCHLSEFQHVEFEGKIKLDENVKIAKDLLKYVTDYLLKNNRDNLSFFLEDNDLVAMKTAMADSSFKEMTLKEALALLYKDTGDEEYKEFSLKNFGSWEEVRVTNIAGANVILKEFPMLEIPFYHNELKKDENGVTLTQNADIILNGFRETIGAGQRIKDIEILKNKAKVFNLPLDDYEPYLKMRELENYQETSGFGMGWQRYVQWLLKLPYIWEATYVPRSHLIPKP